MPFVPIEHFYSPYPVMDEIKRHDFSATLPEKIPGIDLNTVEQLNLLGKLETFYKELPFKEKKTEGLRYYFDNNSFRYSDAIFLFLILRYLKPKKIIEAGSGFSSCITLDTNEFFFNNTMKCIFIEPYPRVLKSLIRKNDKSNCEIHESKLQKIPLGIFRQLEENDVLFIDSTHISKFNSDVNYIIHAILPELQKGVYIHFHDIVYPFEYKQERLSRGVAWNEQYILRSFLEYNSMFKIVLFNSYLERFYNEEVLVKFPLVHKAAGNSIWLKKTDV
ncbi:hypothetical protein FACS1894147_12730 [Spirochaetia bacterium]|nr:hypothetical protein FACS1894147_12730 [Spirochaetia bacterium]